MFKSKITYVGIFAALVFVFIFSCQPSETQNEIPLAPTEKKMPDSISCNVLFSVPVDTFFNFLPAREKNRNQKDIVNGITPDFVYTPKCLIVKDSGIYISNESAPAIYQFSLSGKLISSVIWDKKLGPAVYFDILPNGHIVFCNYVLSKITEIDADGNKIYEDNCLPALTIIAGIGNDNFAYVRENQILADKNRSVIRSNSQLLSSVYLIDGNNIFYNITCDTIARAHLNKPDSLISRVVFPPTDAPCLGLIGAYNESLLQLWPFEHNGPHIAKLVYIDKKGLKKIKEVFLNKPQEINPREFIWPDRGTRWPFGVVYFFDSKRNILYGMATNKTHVNILCWKLN